MTKGKEKAARVGTLPKETQDQHFVLRLYVTGLTPNSTRAVANAKAICEEHIPGRYDLQIIDIYQQPKLAKKMQIIAAPTLVKKLPPPLRRLVGDLSQVEQVLKGLDLFPAKDRTARVATRLSSRAKR